MARLGFDFGSLLSGPLRTRFNGQTDEVVHYNPKGRVDIFQDFTGPANELVIHVPLFSAAGAANILNVGNATVSTGSIMMPTSGILTATQLIAEDALAAHDTNYVTFAITNNGADGSQATAMLVATDASTTKATGGVAIAAEIGRALTPHATPANVRVCAGDLITVTATTSGTLANVSDFPVVRLTFQILPDGANGFKSRTVKTAAAVGTGVSPVANSADGEFGAYVVATNEAQVAGFDWGDQLLIPATKRPIFSCKVKVLETLANQRFVFGLASAFNSTFDSTTYNAWFRLEGADDSLFVEQDDNTTDTDDQDSGKDQTDATYAIYTVDMRDTANIKFYVNNDLVKTISRTSSAWSASALLQPVLWLQKASGTGVNNFVCDWVRVNWDRS